MPTPDDDDELAEFLEPEESEQDRAGRETTLTAEEPAWRARLRQSSFGQAAVVLVTTFAVAIVAWMVVGPDDPQQRTQAETSVISQVEVDGVQAAPVVGAQAPAFTGIGLDGQEVSLESFAGRPVWLVFMATWCTGCRTEVPDIQSTIAEHGERVQLVVVYVGEGSSVVGAYSERVGNDFTQIPDQGQAIAAAYGIMGVPAHYFIGADVVVERIDLGLLGPQEMAVAIEELTGS